MSWGFLKRKRFGPFTINLSKRGPSLSAKLGPLSTNTRTRRLRLSRFGAWIQTKRLGK